ncbi:MAG: hypothetical protein JOZ25_09620 [Actinobacteria bacterium]|nr:hypothetical protein [Actinomycetota bacterium]
MIVRIAGEGQFEVSEDVVDRLNELDNTAVAAVESGDEAAFHQLFVQLIELVESEGSRLADDELVVSDVIVPPRDITFDEAKAEFTGEGLIPN